MQDALAKHERNIIYSISELEDDVLKLKDIIIENLEEENW